MLFIVCSDVMVRMLPPELLKKCECWVDECPCRLDLHCVAWFGGNR